MVTAWVATSEAAPAGRAQLPVGAAIWGIVRCGRGAEYGVPAEGVRKIVMNPVYDGWPVYARVEVTRPAFVAVRLTPDAAELGLTVALPETVSVAMASPAGFEPATRCLEGSRSGPLSYGDARSLG